MDRDGHACMICGTSDRVTFHHCRPRGAGGSATPIPPHLAIAVHGSGTTGCHGRLEREGREDGWAYRLGYLVRHGLRDPDQPHLVYAAVERSWYELFPSGVRTIRPDLPQPDLADIRAAFGDWTCVL